jgi:hypothetical protein
MWAGSSVKNVTGVPFCERSGLASEFLQKTRLLQFFAEEERQGFGMISLPPLSLPRRPPTPLAKRRRNARCGFMAIWPKPSGTPR